MKTKIIGITLAVIMIASIFGALAPTSARDATDGWIAQGDVVYKGERLLNITTPLAATSGILYGIKDSTADGEQIVVSDAASWTVPTTIDSGPYNKTSREGTTADLIIDDAELTAGVFINGTTDSVVGKSIPRGTLLQIRAEPNFGGTIRQRDGTASQIKFKLDEPAGTAFEYSKLVDADAQEIIVYAADWTTAPTLDTTDWDTGTWKVKVSTDKATCNDLDISSAEYEFTVRAEELSVEVEDDEVGKGTDIVVTVNGNPNTYYYTIVTDVDATAPPAIKTGGDIKALSAGNLAVANIAAWIKTGSDGLAEFKIATTGADDRTYTIKVYKDPGTPTLLTELTGWEEDTAITASSKDDDVKAKVVEATVSLDLPSKAIIGEEVKIAGGISAGDKVDVIIKDESVVENDEPVDENKEFSVEWDTDGFTTGSYTIEVYIDQAQGGTDADAWDSIDSDGKATIRLIEPGLEVSQPRNVIAEKDDYKIEGTATGVDDVDYILVGPKGWKAGKAATVLGGVLISSASVSDDEFSEEETMTNGLDTGIWITVALAPGRDGLYQTGEGAGGLTLTNLCVTAGKSQSQILEIIEDKVTEAGSDDDMKTLSFKVESAYVSLNPVESVGIGEPLEITGTTNREPETSITISTFAGPMDLLALSEVEWTSADYGEFSASIDTADAVEGTYTLEADDGDGNTDSVTVVIGEAPAPTAPATATPTAPPATATPTAPATAAPATAAPATPEPTPEEPGFEAVFAIAGLLAVAYLVLRIKK